MAKATQQAGSRARRGTQASCTHANHFCLLAGWSYKSTLCNSQQPLHCYHPPLSASCSTKEPLGRQEEKDYSKAGCEGTSTFMEATNHLLQHQGVQTAARQMSAWICSVQS